MSTTATQGPLAYPEPSNIEFSIGILIHRILRLPAADREDLALLFKELETASTPEEIDSIKKAALEILDQPKERIEQLDVDCGDGGSDRNRKWKDFISRKLRDFRTAKGLTQDQMADASGIPQSHISRIENGMHSPSRKTLERLAAALQIALRDFDPGDDES